ncbi:splicing factor, Prp19-binding domain-containing protein [Mycotypha africana]|uniref:splicing factor, Prp19-binding domain-containing protein n=1 Tax=Mycotypha africana TaxID=64632 RepID=UPI0022FFF074|nr:splicing factor, Prp19-binding domain-containing protein [Mycotypha africana]KAI8977346.1 splicing factor, Prp19-binding domain-containing protein [Mycotypha africana]
MSFRPPTKQQATAPKKQVRRYRAGQVPENYHSDIDEDISEEEEEVLIKQEQQQQQQPSQQKKKLEFAQKDVQTGIQQTVISDREASHDRRLRRLQQVQQQQRQEGSGFRSQGRRRDVSSSEEEEESSDDEATKARERLRLKQKALQYQASGNAIKQEDLDRGIQQPAIKQESSEEEDEEEEEEEESSSEYESSSEEEEDTLLRLPKPVFIPKSKRATILEQEKLAKEAEEREKRLEEEIEERKKQSHALLADELKREKEKAAEKNTNQYEAEVDDTDGLDEEAEYNAWKIRELNRIKRDREERIKREKEEEELERRRALPEEVRLKEDLERAKQTKESKDPGQFTFMQKYYHKGAFFQDTDDEVFKRDYTAPTIDEVRHKELLPKVMQVKNFGLAGRTKYTHLKDQDTSSRDSPWEKPLAKRRRKDYNDKA